MKIIINFVKIFIFVMALYILANNTGQYVNLNILNKTYPQVSLLVVILVSLTIGAVLGGVFMAFTVIQYQSELRTVKQKNARLMTELENLRNLSIDEIPDETLPELSRPAIADRTPQQEGSNG